MRRFFKGILVGIGGISPGLSGSVMLVIFGLYQKTIEAIATMFQNLKKNILFLTPLFLGFGVGILLFSKVVDFLLSNFEMYTRFTFLGLVIGTISFFYKEVKKNGFDKKYYFLIVIFFTLGIILFDINSDLFPTITNPNFFQSIMLGFAVACSTIIPGVDSAVILSAFGLYELYVESISSLNFTILIPACFGLIIGILLISNIINGLIKRYYTITFSIIFGLFLSIIPSVLNESCKLSFNYQSLIAIVFLILGFILSHFFGKLKNN